MRTTTNPLAGNFGSAKLIFMTRVSTAGGIKLWGAGSFDLGDLEYPPFTRKRTPWPRAAICQHDAIWYKPSLLWNMFVFRISDLGDGLPSNPPAERS
jgi:hypothetical protein